MFPGLYIFFLFKFLFNFFQNIFLVIDINLISDVKSYPEMSRVFFKFNLQPLLNHFLFIFISLFSNVFILPYFFIF